jgi:carbamoyl-phosphate synthase large subunit
MTTRVLFMGASRLVGLLQRFKDAADGCGQEVELYSVEDDKPWHAVAAAGLCEVVPGPSFLAPSFSDFLLEFVERRSVHIVIPNIDPATVALSAVREELSERNVYACVSEPLLCRAMFDKRTAAAFFAEHALPHPDSSSYPLLAKPRVGSGSKGHFVFPDAEVFEMWQSKNAVDDYRVEHLVVGTEYTIDAYVNLDGDPVDAVSRVRHVTAGGEVMITSTHRNRRVLDLTAKVLARPGWRGPITVQIIDGEEGCFLIEVNPRFGGGVPCSIEAGLDGPAWILRESTGNVVPADPINWKDGLCLTRSRKDHFVWLS